MKPLVCVIARGYVPGTGTLKFCWRSNCSRKIDPNDDLGLCPRCIEDLRRSTNA